MSITLLGSGHHLHASRRIDGFSTRTHRAEILDETGQPFTAYVKAFPADNKGLVNELTGYVLARTLGLPVSPRAYVILVPIKKLRKLHPETDWPGKAGDCWPCWATAELHNHTLQLVSLHDQIAWRADVNLWPDLPAAIAFCEWLANADANPGNLLRHAPGEYSLIDFAEILGGANWTAKTLQGNARPGNKLLILASGGVPDSATVADCMKAARKHRNAWEAGSGMLYDWWNDLLSPKEQTAAARFIAQRAAPGWITGRI